MGGVINLLKNCELKNYVLNMPCALRTSLLRQCDFYVREYTEAVRKLGGIRRKVAEEDWLLAWKIAEKARLKSAEMLDHLKRHSEEHHC